MKKIHFLCGLPRAGNTILGSLINQSKTLTTTSNSVVYDIFKSILSLKQLDTFLNFPDHNSIDNVIKNVFQVYYKNWETENILDRGPWGCDNTLNIIHKYIDNPKFIVLHRPLIECLISFIKITNPINNEKYCDTLLQTENIISKNLKSLKNLKKRKIKYHLVRYDDLITNPKKTIDNIFNYLGLSKPNINFKDIKQFEINNIKYDDSVLTNLKDLHKLRTFDISKTKYDVKEFFDKKLIQKIEKMDIKF